MRDGERELRQNDEIRLTQLTRIVGKTQSRTKKSSQDELMYQIKVLTLCQADNDVMTRRTRVDSLSLVRNPTRYLPEIGGNRGNNREKDNGEG